MPKKRFSQYDEEFQELGYTLPMLVSSTKNPEEETKQQFIDTHDEFLKLNDRIKDKLADLKTAEKIKEIGKRYNLNLLQIASIARMVRNYYFGKIKLEDMASALTKEMEATLDDAQKIAREIIRRIINDDSRERQYQASLKEITFQEALKKYPEFQEQVITSNHIKLEKFPQPVRPSIKNWLADYVFNLGHKQRTSLMRGNYLFNNKNTQELNKNDRQKLNYLLKAYDKNELIKINIKLKQLIFPLFKEEVKTKTNVAKSGKPTNSEKSLLPDIFQLEKKVASQKDFQSEIAKKTFPKTTVFPKHFQQKVVPKKVEKTDLIKKQPQQSANSWVRKNTQPVNNQVSFGDTKIAQKKLVHNNTALKKRNPIFTSPQQMPFEKEILAKQKKEKEPKPLKITPESLHKSNLQSVSPKNVVNLKNQIQK